MPYPVDLERVLTPDEMRVLTQVYAYHFDGRLCRLVESLIPAADSLFMMGYVQKTVFNEYELTLAGDKALTDYFNALKQAGKMWSCHVHDG